MQTQRAPCIHITNGRKARGDTAEPAEIRKVMNDFASPLRTLRPKKIKPQRHGGAEELHSTPQMALKDLVVLRVSFVPRDTKQ